MAAELFKFDIAPAPHIAALALRPPAGSVRSEPANFTWLVLGCIEANVQIVFLLRSGLVFLPHPDHQKALVEVEKDHLVRRDAADRELRLQLLPDLRAGLVHDSSAFFFLLHDTSAFFSGRTPAN